MTEITLGAQCKIGHERKEGDTVFKRGKEDSQADPKSTTRGDTKLGSAPGATTKCREEQEEDLRRRRFRTNTRRLLAGVPVVAASVR